MLDKIFGDFYETGKVRVGLQPLGFRKITRSSTLTEAVKITDIICEKFFRICETLKKVKLSLDNRNQ